MKFALASCETHGDSDMHRGPRRWPTAGPICVPVYQTVL